MYELGFYIPKEEILHSYRENLRSKDFLSSELWLNRSEVQLVSICSFSQDAETGPECVWSSAGMVSHLIVLNNRDEMSALRFCRVIPRVCASGAY
jgi:hypothetical protein